MNTRLRASDRVYHQVKQQILDGVLVPGEMIGEQQVADTVGVSRTPVREAVQRLQEQGWVRVYPKRGIVVCAPEPGEYEDVVAARVLLETNGARVAIAGGQADLLTERLAELVERQQTAFDESDLSRMAAADADFHQAIAAAGANRILDQLWSGLRERQERMTTRSVWSRPQVRDEIIADHRRLVALIRTADLAGFEAALEMHIRQVHRDLLEG